MEVEFFLNRAFTGLLTISSLFILILVTSAAFEYFKTVDWKERIIEILDLIFWCLITIIFVPLIFFSVGSLVYWLMGWS